MHGSRRNDRDHVPRSRPATVAVGLTALLAGLLTTGVPAAPATAASTPTTGAPSSGTPSAGGTSSTPLPAAPVPGTPSGLPAAIEDPSPYLKQVSCNPATMPGTGALARLLAATYPGTSSGIGRPCATDGIASEHYEGRALDWMVSVRDPAGAARATALIGWLLAPDAAGHPFANARRVGVMYMIWDDHIWGTYAAAAGWRPYSSCATHPERTWDTSCHRNHVHISLSWAGAAGRTSFWTGKVAPTDYGPCRPADLNWAPPYAGANPAPCPAFATVTARAGSSPAVVALAQYSGATIGPGSTGPVVSALERALTLTVDGQFGPLTAAAVSAFRTAHGLAAGTVVDPPTWRALLAAAPPPVSAPPTPSAAPAAPPTPATPASPAVATALAYGARGPAVVALQRALHVTPLSGWFGPVTRAAVVSFQAAHRLSATGVLDAATRRALAI